MMKKMKTNKRFYGFNDGVVEVDPDTQVKGLKLAFDAIKQHILGKKVTQPKSLHDPVVIVVTAANQFAAKELVAILEKLQQLGQEGCSRDISFGGFESLYWDGDGPSRIQSIVVHK